MRYSAYKKESRQRWLGMTSHQPTHNTLSYLSPYKIHVEKSLFKKNLIEMLFFLTHESCSGKFHLYLDSIFFLCAYVNVISFKIGFKCHDCSDFSAKHGCYFCAYLLSYVCKINTKVSSNVIILNIFKTYDEGKTHLSPKKISVCHVIKSHSKIGQLWPRLSLAHPGYAQNESIRLSQQNDAKISNFNVCATYAPSPGNYPLKRDFSTDIYWKSEYTNIVYWIYLCQLIDNWQMTFWRVVKFKAA